MKYRKCNFYITKIFKFIEMKNWYHTCFYKLYQMFDINLYLSDGIQCTQIVQIEIIELIQTQKFSASMQQKSRNMRRQRRPENAKKGFSSCSSFTSSSSFSSSSYIAHVGRIHARYRFRGSMEHINKKSFPACTRVTAHATSLQPLQPIFPALTSREVG